MPAEKIVKRTIVVVAPVSATKSFKDAKKPLNPVAVAVDEDVSTIQQYPTTVEGRENAINRNTGRKVTPFQFQVYDLCAQVPNLPRHVMHGYPTQVNKLANDLHVQLVCVTMKIPKGKISTYKHISDALHSSSRAVGQALKVNPFAPLPVPCHRVLDSKLYIGGFMGQWGKGEKICNKKAKLFNEGVIFDESDHVTVETRDIVVFTDFKGSSTEMAEFTKLAQRMKLNDGSLVPLSKVLAVSKKRKGSSRSRDQYESFSGYGIEPDKSDVQDENRNTLGTRKSSARRSSIDANGEHPPAKKHKSPLPLAPGTSELLKYFTKAPLGDKSNTSPPDAAQVIEARKAFKALQDQDQLKPTHEPTSTADRTLVKPQKREPHDPSTNGKRELARIKKTSSQTTKSEPTIEKDPDLDAKTDPATSDTSGINGVTDLPKNTRSMLEYFKYKPNRERPGAMQQSGFISPKCEDTLKQATVIVLDDTTIHIHADMHGQATAKSNQELSDKESSNAPQPERTRRHRLVRASVLAPGKRRGVNSKSLAPTSLEGSAQESGQEAEPSAPETELEPEPEPDSVTVSRQFMSNYFEAQILQKPNPTNTAPKLPTQPDKPAELVGQPASGVRPRPKTYSKSKGSDVAAKQEQKNNKKNAARRRKTSYSDSDRSESDRNSNEIDDDYLDKPVELKFTPLSRSLLSGGLSNLSNTCYLNSVLQALRNTSGCAEALFAIQENIQRLEENLGSRIKVTEYQRSLFERALEVFRVLDSRERCQGVESSDEKTVYPKEMISTLRQGESLFNSSDQQDAAEFLFYIISQFDDVLKALLQLRQDLGSELAQDIKALIPENWQPIDDLFQVGTQTVTHCQKCPSVSVNMDRSIDLTVQIDTDNPTIIRDLDWGISKTMKMEHMKDDNQRFCEKCDSKEDAHVYHYFTSLPKVMILRLQRYNFKEGAVKIQNGVSCAESMNFEKWMSCDYKGTHPNYELCAMIVHRGRVITSGHYYVYVKKEVEIETVVTESRTETRTFRWLKYNDSRVTPVTDADMAKVLAGNVGTQAVNNISDGAGSLDLDSKEISINDLATPYVYIYRRI
ncbi:Ubiquitin carboxyl-terminal hydrolase 12 [Modicella reniformis]|uniref:Methylated-DNA--protein-cysteine methyltransferase n=1 Tax=Modicella reniformis TaxID=1440133 RepID=A0A9P6M2I0_9FUNG|nr:Ubiquitin carboxyl-terminal hydrolase 12 [Modicella reniformis]